jgi:hypothetical protein
MNQGYIKLWRCIKDNPLWFEEPFTRGQAWVDLLMVANHKPGTIRRRGIRVYVNRGEVGMSLRELAGRWRWSLGKVQRFFEELKTDTQIHHRTDTENVNVTNLICITNYEKYQSCDTEADTEADTETGTETIRKRVQNKNEKNKKNKTLKPTTTRAQEQLADAVSENHEKLKTLFPDINLPVATEKLLNHYKSSPILLDPYATALKWFQNEFAVTNKLSRASPSPLDVKTSSDAAYWAEGTTT